MADEEHDNWENEGGQVQPMTENEKKLIDAAVDWVRAYNAHLDIAKYQKMTALREAANRVSDDRTYGSVDPDKMNSSEPAEPYSDFLGGPRYVG